MNIEELEELGLHYLFDPRVFSVPLRIYVLQCIFVDGFEAIPACLFAFVRMQSRNPANVSLMKSVLDMLGKQSDEGVEEGLKVMSDTLKQTSAKDVKKMAKCYEEIRKELTEKHKIELTPLRGVIPKNYKIRDDFKW